MVPYYPAHEGAKIWTPKTTTSALYAPLPFRFSALYNRYSAAYEVHQAGRGLGLARLFGRPVESTIAK
jgi:hypothetical protein